MAGVGQCQRIGSWYPRYGAGAYAVVPRLVIHITEHLTTKTPDQTFKSGDLPATLVRSRAREIRAAIRLAAARAAAAHARRCAFDNLPPVKVARAWTLQEHDV